MANYIIKRELHGSGYRWEMRGNRMAVIDTKSQIEVVLTKVGAMSLMKFLPNYLDKMRIEEGKALRSSMRQMREKAKAKKLAEKAKKQQMTLLSAKGTIKHEEKN